MTFSFRHITLLIGIGLIIFSFLFFGRETGTYDVLGLIGFVIAAISFLIILIKSDTLKSKIAWTLIVVLAIIIEQLAEPLLIKSSYYIFISRNQTKLKGLNKIMSTKKNGVHLMPTLDTFATKDFTLNEINEIHSLITGTNISLIEKDSDKIFYRTFGMLDVSNGVFYFYGKNKPDDRFKHISGNWFY
jgi:hypothetical protein